MKEKKEKKLKKGSNTVRELDADELALLRATRPELDRSTLPPHDNSDIARARRYVKKNKFSVGFVVLTLLLLVAVVGILAFMLYKTIENNPSKEDFSVTMGKEKFVIPYGNGMRDGAFYFDMRLIADYAELVVSGGEGNIKFSCEDGTYVRFEHGADTATVNGQRVKLGGTAEITPKTKDSNGECFVPFSFIEKLFSYKAESDSVGLGVLFSDRNNTVRIKRIYYKNSEQPLPISFSSDCFESAEGLMQVYFEEHQPASAAYKKMTSLINKNNPLDSSYLPEGLLSLDALGCPISRKNEFFLQENAARSIRDMLCDLNATLPPEEQISVTSAYRSFSYQQTLFEKYVTDLMRSKNFSRAEAEAQVQKTAARAGESEHQSGLCADLITVGDSELSVSFEKTRAFAWLADNAHRYGFILRYPRGKEALTGYSYEPWHYRYVGLDAARVIFEDNICLEEYLAAHLK